VVSNLEDADMIGVDAQTRQEIHSTFAERLSEFSHGTQINLARPLAELPSIVWPHIDTCLLDYGMPGTELGVLCT